MNKNSTNTTILIKHNNFNLTKEKFTIKQETKLKQK